MGAGQAARGPLGYESVEVGVARSARREVSFGEASDIQNVLSAHQSAPGAGRLEQERRAKRLQTAHGVGPPPKAARSGHPAGSGPHAAGRGPALREPGAAGGASLGAVGGGSWAERVASSRPRRKPAMAVVGAPLPSRPGGKPLVKVRLGADEARRLPAFPVSEDARRRRMVPSGVTAAAWNDECSRREEDEACAAESGALFASSAARDLQAAQQQARARRRQHVGRGLDGRVLDAPEGWTADAWAGHCQTLEMDENERLEGVLAMTLAAGRPGQRRMEAWIERRPECEAGGGPMDLGPAQALEAGGGDGVQADGGGGQGQGRSDSRPAVLTAESLRQPLQHVQSVGIQRGCAGHPLDPLGSGLGR